MPDEKNAAKVRRYKEKRQNEGYTYLRKWVPSHLKEKILEAIEKIKRESENNT